MEKAKAAFAPKQDLVAVEFNRETIERRGGKLEETGGGFRVVFPGRYVDPTRIVEAFENEGFTKSEAYEAVDEAAGKRLWRDLRNVCE